MNNSSLNSSQIILPIAISVSGVLTMSLIAFLLRTNTISAWTISDHAIVNFTFTMQMMVLPISFLAIGLMYRYNRDSIKTFFRLGITSSTESNNWNFYGPAMAVAFTLGTISYMAVSVTSQHGVINDSFYSLLPLVLLFAFTNAWTEEIFARLVIVAGLTGKFNPLTICWISAIIFGVPHFFGTPSGWFGVIMSGLLGWFLAKSVIETKGIGWALFIHFLQDVVIFGAGAMILAGQT